MKQLLYISSFLFSVVAMGQQYPIIGQYNFNEMIINPASTGDNEAMQGLISWRQQWVGVEGSPSTQNFSFQTPIKKQPNNAVGILAYSDKIGVTKQQGLFANYSYQLKIDKNSKIKLGLAAGITFGRSNFSELAVNDVMDPNFIDNTPLFISPNFSFGVKYFFKNLSLGFSVPTLLTNQYSSGGYTKTFNDFSNYNFLTTIKYNYELNKMISLTPSLLVKYHATNRAQIEAMCMVNLREIHGLGIGYRSQEGLLMNLKVGITEQFSLGAQYELPLFNLASYKASTFEILILYNALFKTKANNPRY
jgi:type IX secretion system PorP/SprF family membrane protein